jgi:hypothetical protein
MAAEERPSGAACGRFFAARSRPQAKLFPILRMPAIAQVVDAPGLHFRELARK